MSASPINPVSPFNPAATAAVFATTAAVAVAHHGDRERRDDRGLAEFNDLAGIKPGTAARQQLLTLRQRLAQPRPARVPARRTGNPLQPDAVDAADADQYLRAASADVLDELRRAGPAGLDERLADTYDALERHVLLRHAEATVDESAFSQSEKERVKRDLKGMLTGLMDSHGEAIRAGLDSKDAFETALGAMDARAAGAHAHDHAGSLSELRVLYGSRGNGKAEVGLTPMGLATSLIARFGAASFVGALGGLRKKMATGFRTRPADRAGPRLWLSLADAASFNLVQSCFALAGDLRRDLSQSAQVVGKGSQAETALALLGATELGRGSAEPLLGRIADSAALSELQKMQLYRLTRHAVETLPITAWPKEVPAQRANLLDELRTLGTSVCDQMARVATQADQLERKMRGAVRRLDGDGREGEGEGGGERDDEEHGRDAPLPHDGRRRPGTRKEK